MNPGLQVQANVQEDTMMHPSEISRLSREATQKASKARKLPLVVEAEDLHLSDEALLRHVGHAPFLGDYVPKGWSLTYPTLFVDSSGFGADNEPALSTRQLVAQVRANGPGFAYAITQHGQFQAWLGVYKEVTK